MKIFAILFGVFLLFPFGYLALHSFSNLSEFNLVLQKIDTEEMFWALKNSIYQSVMSSILSLLLAIPLFLGLQHVRTFYSTKVRFWFEFILVLPNLLPSLLIVFLVMDLVEPFPTGIIGVCLIHGYMNAGVVALLLDRTFRKKLMALSEISLVLGSSRFRFLRSSFQIYYRDLLSCLLLVFIFSFASFSVPLLAGGGKATTLEILMFEKLKLTGQYSEALILGLLQWGLLYFMSRWSDSKVGAAPHSSEESRFLASRWGLAFILAVSILPFLFLFWEMISGFESLFQIENMAQQIQELLVPSLFFSLMVSVGISILLIFVSYSFEHNWIVKFLKSFTSPSTSMMGLVLLLLLLKSGYSEEAFVAWLLWLVGLLYIYLPILFRWGWMSELNSLDEQIQVAKTLGASRNRIFFHIILPQMAPRLAWLSTVAGVWALGDFAFGKILLSQTQTLSMLAESLLTSYRIHAGLAVMGIVVGLAIFQAVLIQGVQIVYRHWFEKKIYS